MVSDFQYSRCRHSRASDAIESAESEIPGATPRTPRNDEHCVAAGKAIYNPAISHLDANALSRNLMPEINPLAGKPVPPSMLVNIPRLVTAYFAGPARSVGAGAAGRVRHLGASRLGVQQRLQRGAHPGDQPGALRSPAAQPDRRPAVPRHGHPRAVGAGVGERARGAGGQRRRGDDRRARRLHADAGDLARDPDLQPRPRPGPGRRHRDHAVAQSARRRRLQIQSAQRRSGRYRYHGWIERAANALSRRRPARRQAHSL